MLARADLRCATAADVAAVADLLAAAGLPTVGVEQLVRAPNVLVVATDGRAVLGAVGLEAHGAQRLLRSLVVAPRARSVGIGRSLVRRALEVAGGREVILLTETAPGFVEALGFDTVERAAVVGPVTTSGEWTSLCPDTAVVMRRAATAT